MTSYELVAILLVLAIPVATICLVAGALAWARDAIDRAPVAGGIGVVVTLVAAGNAMVERTCGPSVNRPVITAFLGPEGCRAGALAAVDVVLLLAVATALVARTGELRRSPRSDGPVRARAAGGGSTVAR